MGFSSSIGNYHLDVLIRLSSYEDPFEFHVLKSNKNKEKFNSNSNSN